MSLGEHLRQAMKTYGSIYRLAKDSGIGQPILQRFYTGQRDLQLATVERLAGFFGMTLTEPTRQRHQA